MTKYFTVTTSQISADEEKKIAEHWKSYGWWHGVGSFWLFRDHTDTKTAASLRDEVRAIVPQARAFVMEVDPKMWAGSGMNESNREWLRKYWPPEGG